MKNFLDAVLNFLNRIGDKWLVFLLFIICYAGYLWLRTDFLGQLTQTVIGALIALLVQRELNRADDINPPRARKLDAAEE